MPIRDRHGRNLAPWLGRQRRADFLDIKFERIHQAQIFIESLQSLTANHLPHHSAADIGGIHKDFGYSQDALLRMVVINNKTPDFQWLAGIECFIHPDFFKLEQSGGGENFEHGAKLIHTQGHAVEHFIAVGTA